MAKVNKKKYSDYFKSRVEQRFTHWIKKAEETARSTEKELSEVKFWQINKKLRIKNKLLASYLEIQIIKGAILEIRLLQ